jgi:hypothetical protein
MQRRCVHPDKSVNARNSAQAGEPSASNVKITSFFFNILRQSENRFSMPTSEMYPVK